jgi:hypothetical protein|tara:strand:+ start:2094 stop:2720 length:627 start_codon:yes stop_codon:yes gene_type:complete
MTTFTTLTADVRRLYGETATTFTSDADILRWLNIGLRDWEADTGVQQKPQSVTTVSGTREYDIVDDVGNVQRVFYDDSPLLPVSYKVMTNYDEDTDETGIPGYYYVRFDDYQDIKIGLIPIPNDAKVLRYFYTQVEDTDYLDSANIPVPPDHRHAIVNFACAQWAATDGDITRYSLFSGVYKERKAQWEATGGLAGEAYPVMRYVDAW